MKYVINDTTLTAIGDAVRGKAGTTELIPVSELADAITNLPSGGGGSEVIPPEVFDFTGNASYLFANDNWKYFLDNYASQMTFEDISDCQYMFGHSRSLEDLSQLTINLLENNNNNIQSIFYNCNNLKKLPKISGIIMRYLQSFFGYCYQLSSDEINNFFDNISVPSTDVSATLSNMFQNCYSVRDLTKALDWIDTNVNNYTGTSQYIVSYSYLFNYCVSLDEITNLLVINCGSPRTSDAFSGTFGACARLKNMIFKTDNGAPIVAEWKKQTIDLTIVGNAAHTGYHDIINYNSGITADKEVYDDASYQALKNDPDWWSQNIAYSRYNHDSAVNTINSLPDTSAYLATTTGTNTIKFKGAAGSATDGGAINTLTEEEIAVATAKGWTVSFA